MNDEQIYKEFKPILGHASDLVKKLKINDNDGNEICFAAI